MRKRFGQDWSEQEPMADINVVPLVDVLLVLLVIFMITAPIIAQSLDVQLPQATLSPSTRTDQTLIISLDQSTRLAVNDKVLGPMREQAVLQRLETEIRRWQAAAPGAPAFLRADRRLRYASVIQVMAHLRQLGVVDVGLMIERE